MRFTGKPSPIMAAYERETSAFGNLKKRRRFAEAEAEPNAP